MTTICPQCSARLGFFVRARALHGELNCPSCASGLAFSPLHQLLVAGLAFSIFALLVVLILIGVVPVAPWLSASVGAAIIIWVLLVVAFCPLQLFRVAPSLSPWFAAMVMLFLLAGTLFLERKALLHWAGW